MFTKKLWVSLLGKASTEWLSINAIIVHLEKGFPISDLSNWITSCHAGFSSSLSIIFLKLLEINKIVLFFSCLTTSKSSGFVLTRRPGLLSAIAIVNDPESKWDFARYCPDIE